MADEEELLTPYQKMLEGNRLGQRGLEAAAASFETRNANPNPFIEERTLPQATAVPEGATTVIAPPPRLNPLVQPPVPLSMMPVAKQIAWQELQDKQRMQQADLENKNLNAEINRQNLELRAEQIRQNRGLTAEIPKLREALNRSTDDYLELKADLAQRFPIGVGSPEMDRVFGEYEKIYTKKESVKAELNKAKIAREDAAKQERIKAGYKEAEKLGQDVVAKYAALIDEKPTEAFAELANAQNANVMAQLKASGKTEQEIAQAYGGPGTNRPLDYAAALADQKTRTALEQANVRATADFVVLDKLRANSGFDPADAKQLDAQGKPKDPFAESQGWTPDMEAAWTSKRDYMISLTPKLTPKISGNRGGVAGMSTEYMPYLRQLNPAARVATPGAAPQGAPQRVPLTQQAAEPVGTQKVINGVASVKYPDGKWYKIKQK